MYVLPEDAEDWEGRLVPEDDRSEPRYGSWALVVSFEQLAQDFEPVAPAT